jgi:hypothetical protein
MRKEKRAKGSKQVIEKHGHVQTLRRQVHWTSNVSLSNHFMEHSRRRLGDTQIKLELV